MKENNKKEPKGDIEQPQPDAGCDVKASPEYLDVLNKYLRLAAELDNARKRWDRDRDDLLKYGESALLKEVLVILDELKAACSMAREHKDSEQIARGLEMTCKNFEAILKKRGLEVIESVGKPFDPHFQEIAASRPAEGIDAHVVLEEIQKGYMLADKVLRTAKVIVGVPLATNPQSDQGESRRAEGAGGKKTEENKPEEGLGEA